MFNARTLFLSTLVCASLLGLPTLTHCQVELSSQGAGAEARESVTQQSVVVVPDEADATAVSAQSVAGAKAGHDLEGEATHVQASWDEGTALLKAGDTMQSAAGEEATQDGSEPAEPATPGTEHAAENGPAPDANAAAGGASDDAVNEAGQEDGFVPSVALVRRLAHEAELPAMQMSLGFVDFVGEVEGTYPGEDSFAILPLRHDAVIEVYELNYDGLELSQREGPSVVHELANHEAYVFRVPYVAGMPTREVCVRTNGMRHCWRPGSGGLGQGFLYWQKTKGMD